MRISLNLEGVLVACKETEGKEGKKYYSISLENNDEAGTFNTTEEVYNKIKDGTFKKYQPYSFGCLFNSQYNSFSVQRLLPPQK